MITLFELIAPMLQSEKDKESYPIMKKLIVLLSVLFFHSNSYSLTCNDIDGAEVLSQDESDGYFSYLGFFGTADAAESIMNPSDEYGNSSSLLRGGTSDYSLSLIHI